MPTTTLKPKTTKGGSATKLSLTNASAEKSRKMLEQMLAKKLSSSTKVPKTMTIKTGATKKSTTTRSASGSGLDDHAPGMSEQVRETLLGPPPAKTRITESMTFKCTMIDPPPKGGYRKKGYVKKSSCAMSAKKPMSAKPRPKTAKK